MLATGIPRMSFQDDTPGSKDALTNVCQRETGLHKGDDLLALEEGDRDDSNILLALAAGEPKRVIADLDGGVPRHNNPAQFALISIGHDHCGHQRIEVSIRQ